MKRWAVLVLLALSACSYVTRRDGPPEAYQSRWDAFLVRTEPWSRLLGLPCADPIDRCFKMLPRQRWRGIWIAQGGESLFVPDAILPPAKLPTVRIWLTLPADMREPLELRGKAPGRAYLVEVIGRRTAIPGRYGDDGDSDHELVADRFVSMRLVEQRPDNEHRWSRW